MDKERSVMQFYFIAEAEMGTHYHQELEILYVLKGEMRIRIDDVKYILRDGDFILINANKRHAISTKKEFLGARFVIDFHLLAEYIGNMQLMFWCNTVADRNDAYEDVRRLLDRILERYFEKDEKGALYLNALYFETLYLLTTNFMVKADDVWVNGDNSQVKSRVKQIQNYIQANYQSQISLNDLAEKLYLSNAYLSKYIKKHLGMSFMDYLNNVRLFHAVDELLYTEKNITRIALDNGFPTSASFTKAFRDIHGEAPSEYRKKMRHQRQEYEQEDEEKHEEVQQQRIQEYLNYKKQQEEPEADASRLCEADATDYVKRDMLWNKAVNVGEAYSLLQSEVQNQLIEIQKGTGMVYARIWNLLSRKNCFDEREGYNFRKLDRVLDFLVENHMKPYIELGHKPEVLMYTPERVIMEENNGEIYDFETFSGIIKALCIHLANRYGVEEVEGWIFEYWNDPKLHISEADGAYYPYFEMIYRTLRDISPVIRVGGAGFILGYETPVCKEIFRIWRKRQIHPDFLSFCSFQYVSIAEAGQSYGKKSIDGHYMQNQVQLIREVMDEVDFHVPELYIDEWNFTLSNRNVLNDSCEQGAYIMKTCINMAGNVDLMAYWHGLDSYSEYYDSDTVLNGDSGMISRDGIRKPSFYAFHFLNKLQPLILKKGENCIVTTNGRDRYVIACYNYKRLSPDYVFMEEDQITVENQDQFIEDRETLDLKLRLRNVKDGSYQVKMYYVNDQNGNAQEIWKKLDYTSRLSKDEVEYMKQRAVPTMEMKNLQVENGVLELDSLLMPQEIRLIDIRYRYNL